MNTSWFLSLYIPVITCVFIAAITLYMYRILRGPTILDMVLGIDCMSYDLAVFIALVSLYYDTSFLIIGSLMISLWAFMFDVYISKYYLKRELGD